MRTDCTPHQVGSDGETKALRRVPLGENSFPENKLQELLHHNPSILPASRFDGNFGPLVSLGREVRHIDNLFISPSGRLTVVETKLWRNPQATREVLAQVLDYAGRLSTLSCEELEAECRQARQSPIGSGENLYGLVEKAYPGQAGSEHEFLDRLQRTIRQGRFLLLVVGDGIRENLEQVLERLYGQSRLAFTFGLVELQFYQQPDSGEYLVIPNIPARSVEVVRAIVTVSDGGSGSVNIEVPSDEPDKGRRLSEQDFLETVTDPEARKFGERLIEWAHDHKQIVAKPAMNSISVRVPFSTTRDGLVLLRLTKVGKVLVTPPKLRKELNKAEVSDEDVFWIAESVQNLFPDIKIDPDAQQIAAPLRAATILPKMDRFLEIYGEAIERLRRLDPEAEAASLDDTVEDEDDSEQNNDV